MFFVYVDCKPDGTPFYIGKGNMARLYAKKRNQYHARVCAKNPGWYRGLAFMGSEKEALAKEIELIAKYRKTLTNFTNGGEGTSGYKQSPETIAKKIKNIIGIKRPKEVGQNISAAKTGKPCNHKQYICIECGMVANNGNLTKHQTAHNHAGKAIL